MSTPKTQRYQIRNWSKYNAALINRGSIHLWIDAEAIASWNTQERSGKQGASDHYSDAAILCVLTIKEVYGLPLRQTQGFVQSLFALMGTSLDVPNDTTLSRRRQRLEVPLPVRQSNSPLHLVVDSTGLKVYGEGEWKVRQHGYGKRRTWQKLHLGVDEQTNEIVAVVVTTNATSDSEVLGDILASVNRPMTQVSADGAYDTLGCYEAIVGYGADAVIPPRTGARQRKHGPEERGVAARNEVLREIAQEGRAEWKRRRGYHRRSKAESGMYRYKAMFGDRLSSRGFSSQSSEAFIKCGIMNRVLDLGMPQSIAVT